MIAVRTDANEKIGTGHLMRCLAIAKKLWEIGEEAVFITADERPNALLKQAGFHHLVLDTEWTHMEDEIPVLSRALQYCEADLLLADSYCASAGYFNEINKIAGTAYIDDFAENTYPVDILINYNAYCDESSYRQLYGGRDAKLLLGPMFAPLREEFRGLELPPVRGRIENILITTGGTDCYGIAYSLAARMLRDPFFKDIRISVAAGAYFANVPELRELSRQHENLTVHEHSTSMSELMLNCDVAVSASGSTLYELCACGAPSVIFGIADNQTRIRGHFGKTGAMIDCGDYRDGPEDCLNNVVRAVKALERAEARAGLRRKAANITDGLGSSRIALELADCARQKRGRID